MERRLDKLEVIYQLQRRRRVLPRPDLSMLSEEELLELEAMAEACEPSIVDPSGEGALTLAQKARLAELIAKVEGGSCGSAA